MPHNKNELVAQCSALLPECKGGVEKVMPHTEHPTNKKGDPKAALSIIQQSF